MAERRPSGSRCSAAGVPSGPVNDVEAALADPQAVARGDVVEYEHPTLGVVRGPCAAVPALDGGPPPAHARADARRAHDDVLREVCGYDDERLGRLAGAGTFGIDKGDQR